MKSSDVLAESLGRHNDGARRLTSGTLDAMFVGASYPAEAVRIASAAGARLIPLTGRGNRSAAAGIPLLENDRHSCRTVLAPGSTNLDARPG